MQLVTDVRKLPVALVMLADGARPQLNPWQLAWALNPREWVHWHGWPEGDDISHDVQVWFSAEVEPETFLVGDLLIYAPPLRSAEQRGYVERSIQGRLPTWRRTLTQNPFCVLLSGAGVLRQIQALQATLGPEWYLPLLRAYLGFPDAERDQALIERVLAREGLT